MKSRGTLKHTLLMQEVIDQLKSRFKPKIRLIKVEFVRSKSNLATDSFHSLEMH